MEWQSSIDSFPICLWSKIPLYGEDNNQSMAAIPYALPLSSVRITIITYHQLLITHNTSFSPMIS